jgi:4-amino-4-deoxy-L-arabinose transferase-like glycosyltransferase
VVNALEHFLETVLARRYIALIFIALGVLAAGIGTYSLRGSTELRETGIAAEMLQDSQYIVPRLNGRPFLEKPPLSYWAQAFTLQLIGYESAAVRLPSIVAGIACLCVLFFGLDKLYGNDGAWLGAMLLLTMASFWMNARTAGQDALLTFGVSLALCAFNIARNDTRLFTGWLLYACGIAVAVFTKGVVGLAVPGFVIFCYVAMEAIFIEKKINWTVCWRIALFSLLGVLPFLAWLFILWQREGNSAVAQILWSNSVERFTGDYQFGAHSEPAYYYLKKLPETFAPWNVLLFVALWRLRHLLMRDRNVLFFCCWLLTPYLLLSFSSGKRPTYLLMIYPAAAALIAAFAYRLKNSLSGAQGEARNMLILGALQAVLISAIALAVVKRTWHFHEHIASIAAAIILAGILVALWRMLIAKQFRSLSIYSLLAMLVMYAVYGGVTLKHESRQDSLEAVFAEMRTLQQAKYSLALYAPIERVAGATSFYLQRTLPEINNAEQLKKFLEADHHAAVLIADNDLDNLNDYRVIAGFSAQKRKYLIVANAETMPLR